MINSKDFESNSLQELYIKLGSKVNILNPKHSKDSKDPKNIFNSELIKFINKSNDFKCLLISSLKGIYNVNDAYLNINPNFYDLDYLQRNNEIEINLDKKVISYNNSEYFIEGGKYIISIQDKGKNTNLMSNFTRYMKVFIHCDIVKIESNKFKIVSFSESDFDDMKTEIIYGGKSNTTDSTNKKRKYSDNEIDSTNVDRDVRSDYQTLLESNRKLAIETVKLRRENSNITKENKTIATNYNYLVKKYNEKKLFIKKLEDETNSLIRSNDTYRDLWKSSVENVKVLGDNILTLQTKVNCANRDSDRLKQQINILKNGDSVKLNEEIKILNSYNEKLRVENKEKDTEIENIKGHLVALTQECDDLKEKIDSNEKVINLITPKGKDENSTVEKDKEKFKNKTVTCRGCEEDQPNQLAHMDPGGCMYESEDDLF